MSFIRPEVLLESMQEVVSQEPMKRRLASVFSQYTLYLQDPEAVRPTALIYGPSGAGKTFAVETLAKALELPFTVMSAPGISTASYKGATLRDLLVQHYMEFGRDEGIIFLDEIDKWCSTAVGPDYEARGVGRRMQGELLRYMEKEKVEFVDEAADHDKLENEEGEVAVFDTSRVLWVVGGAFIGLEMIVRKRLENWTNSEPELFLANATAVDFEVYGLIREMVGRVQSWIFAKPLTRQEMMLILQRQEVPRWQRRFRAVGCELDFHAGALAECANRAFEDLTGARGAASYLRKALDELFLAASSTHLSQLEITVDLVKTGKLEAAVR